MCSSCRRQRREEGVARAADANAKFAADGSVVNPDERDDEGDSLWSGEPHPMCVVRAEIQVWCCQRSNHE
jgi:hypothetical protein